MYACVKKSPILVLLLTTILASAAYGFALCGEVFDQEYMDKAAALLFLRDVACIDLDAYDARVTWLMTPSGVGDLLYPAHVQTGVTAYFSNNISEYEAFLEFIDGKIYHFSLDNMRGGALARNPELPPDSIALAKFTLERFESSFNATYCDGFKAPLERITQLGNKQEIDLDGIVLKAACSDGGASFVWCLKIDGTLCPKKGFSLTFKEGSLCGLDNSWGHYILGNTESKLSKEEAITKALSILLIDPSELNFSKDRIELIQKHFNEEGAKVSEHEASLLYVNRDGNYFTLDAAWCVEFKYDKMCSYNINGFVVELWAGSGEVFHICPQGFYGNPQASAASDTSSLPTYLLVSLISAMIMMPIVFAIYKKIRKR